MKKALTLLVACFGATAIFSQTLFSYGPYAVGKDEFLKAYNKNKTPVTDKEQSLREYLDLYVKFKLKVKTAQELHLDTLRQLKLDLQNFRSQVAEAYMTDAEGLKALEDEAIERSQKDIHLQHFYVDVNTQMSAADTLKAYQAMNELAEELKKSNSNYTEVVKGISKKYPEIKADDMGFITALMLPYEIENIAYGLQPGGVSKPYRTKKTLHLFKHVEERKSVGKWKIAQILFAIPPDASVAELKAIKARADSVYQLLVAGADFAEMAKLYSEDKLTYLNGGELPEFGTGKFDVPFESKVFELKKDGDISRPIITDFGFHIVKRLQQQYTPADKTDEAFAASLKQQILQDSRVEGVNATFLKTVKTKTGFKRNALVKDAELFRYADSVSKKGAVGKYPINNKTILSFKTTNVKGLSWLNFVQDYKLNKDVYQGETNKELLEKFIATSALDYYRKHLDEYDTAFKYQMEEFKQGNMLFEIMERNVWNKAASDSLGLKRFYEANKKNYKWGASAAAILFSCGDSAAAKNAVAALQSGKSWKLIVEESDAKVQADSGRFELSQIQLSTGEVIKEGFISKPVASGDNTSGFVKVLRLFPADEQRSFEEAKGLVINDYQNYLEEKWVKELKAKYPVKVDGTVFQSLLR